MKNTYLGSLLILLATLGSACHSSNALLQDTTSSASSTLNPLAIPQSGTISNKLKSDLIGLATPIQLQRGHNVINLLDYFLKAEIDSIHSDRALPFILNKAEKTITLDILEVGVPLSNLSLYAQGQRYDIMVKSPNKKALTLKLKNKDYTDVKIKGEMNAWNPSNTAVVLREGYWQTELELNPGNYQYKYIVNGEDINDPENEITVSNGSGGFNSLLTLAKPKKEDLSILQTAYHNDSIIGLDFSALPTMLYAYCDNQKLDYRIAKSKIEIQLPHADQATKRSTIRVWAYNQHGLSNDLLIPLDNGKVITDASQLNRSDKEAQLMYFTLIDRFANGNKSNDDPIKDDRLKPLTNYEGGDLAGITKKIKEGYFQKLNINAIWLSPITQNPLKAYQEYIEPQYYYSGYHGYWPISSSKIDHRFGTDAELTELVEEAHKADINILLDYVTNHVHEDHPMYKAHPEYSTDLILPDGSKNLRIWDEQRLTTWFDTFMPSLDLENEAVIDLQVDSTIYWLKKYNLDGYRHDATKHIPEAFWQRLTRKLKEEVMAPEGRSLYQIGETYGSRDLIKSYISSGMLDSQFDFNLYFDVREVFAKQDVSFSKLVTSLEETFSYYGYHSSMGYISGNHDQARFISLASGDVSFSEDHKMAGFNRDITITDAIGYDRLEMLMAFIMTIPGVPVIYYGDEIGMPGAGDPDTRRMMRFEGLKKRELETRTLTQKLTTLRKNNLALTYGDTEILDYTDDTFIMKRTYFDETVVVLFNKSTEAKVLTMGIEEGGSWVQHFEGDLRKAVGSLRVELAPWSFEILTHKK